MTKHIRNFGKARAAHSAALAVMALAVNSALAVEPTSTNPVVISLSGSTAMRNFTTSAGFSYLTPGTSITLNTGVGGAPQTYSAPDAQTTVYQLASPNFNAPEDTTNSGLTNHKALQLEWHEQGSLEGISEMVNDQIAPYPGLTDASRTPSTPNPTWINTNKFLGTGSTNGFTIGNFGGANSQAKVQMAISDVNAHQGFAIAGTPSWNAAPGTPGFGQGNPALPAGATVLGVGQAGIRHSYQPDTVLNMPAGAPNPAGGTIGVGPWNTAGIDNLQNTPVANTATLFVANPGTGLTQLNRTDAQFLQAQGRLANGADFNMTTRDVNSGTLNVSSANIGLDPTFANGENDGGTGSAAEQNVGSIKFTNKSSGGTLRTTVQNSRMAVGHLVMGDAIGNTNNSNGAPLRALAYRDDANDVNDNSNGASWNNYTDAAGILTVSHGDLPSGTFIQPSITSITDGAYPIFQTENYVTVKNPGAAFAGLSASAWAATTDLQTGIKGDNSGSDVADVRANILSSVKNYPQSSSIATPGDQLIATSFILPQMMLVQKTTDGLNQSVPNPTVSVTLRQAIVADPNSVNRFNPAMASTVSTGSGSTYGTVTTGQGTVSVNNNNWFFGDFNKVGAASLVRDFSDLAVMQQAQTALQNSTLGISIFAGAANSNNQTVPGAPAAMTFSPTKGDMVVLGDYNSDGVFDGQDLYLFARGAALADNTSSTALTGNFGDSVRNGVLRKNAALDFLSTAATATQKIQASASLTNDPSGLNAFNKRDVNRDGIVDLKDAFVVDKFTVGGENTTDHFSRITSLTDQINATINIDGGIDPTLANQRPVSLVDVEQTDDQVINNSDVGIVNQGLTVSGHESWTGSLVKNGIGAIVIARPTSDANGSTTIAVASGASLTINAGSFTAGGTADPFTDTTTGRHLPIVNSSATSLNISGGTKNVATLSGAGNTNVSAGATLIATSINQNTLSLAGTAQIRSGGGAIGASTVNSIITTGAGKLDVNDNTVTVPYTPGNSPASAIRAMLVTGFAGGDWSGPGVDSTAAHNDASFRTALGYNDTGSSILVKYTEYGDNNLDGSVTTTDFQALLDGLVANGSTWAQGDYTYDGHVDLGNDFILFLENYLAGGGQLGDLGPIVRDEPGLSNTQRASLLAVVPEPSTAAVLLVAATGASPAVVGAQNNDHRIGYGAPMVPYPLTR